MKLIAQNNKNLLAQEKTNSAMLKTNRDADGKVLTAQQRAILTEQNQAIREKLLEANQMYTTAAEEKMKQNKKLSQEEMTQTLATLGDSYKQRMTSIQENEARIKELRDTITKTKDAAEKQAAQNELDALNTKNGQLLEAQNNAGIQMVELLNQNGQLNAASVLAGMQQMGAVTDSQIVQIVQKFANFGASTQEQLGLVAGIMGQKGLEGSAALAQGIQNQDFSAIPVDIRNKIAAGLQSLPPAMFKNGDDGKQQFIDAIKKGNYKAAAKAMPKGIEDALTEGKGPTKKKGR
ncbi:hypothetical protein [Listeria fleischmannii]|uniref:hypothetical protein n=1 Tax=Listeria fleischmannii TaxID=1069827 RepID=UPI0004B761D9|nr:hypothetical protein [Listeria fleischmannii]